MAGQHLIVFQALAGHRFMDGGVQVPEKNGAADRLLSAEEVSQKLGVPVSTLYIWRHRKTGPPALRVGRYLRYRPGSLDRWIESLEDQPA